MLYNFDPDTPVTGLLWFNLTR